MSDDDTYEEIYRKFFTTDDLIKLEWKILKYMCDMSGIYDTFPETLLFHRNYFKTFIDRKLKQGCSDDKVGKLYKLIMDKVMIGWNKETRQILAVSIYSKNSL